MKKIVLFLIFIPLIFISCNMKYKNNLSKMRKVLERHIVQRDIDNETQTTVESIKALSYTEIPDAERQYSADAYLAKIYLKSRWVYLNSSRIYNVDDTLDVYYDKDLRILRIEE